MILTKIHTYVKNQEQYSKGERKLHEYQVSAKICWFLGFMKKKSSIHAFYKKVSIL